MNIAVLFDGAGLARLGLEQAGHTCTGFENDPTKHYLSQMVGSGRCVLADVRDVDLSGFDAIWASPPCQEWSDNDHGTAAKTGEFLDWSLNLINRFPEKTIWIENVLSRKRSNSWGTLFNAAQFLVQPIQNRPRVVKLHNADLPRVYRPYQKQYADLDICPTVVAKERSGGGFSFNPKTERRKASMWFGRPMSIREMAYAQGFDIPDGLLRSWFHQPPLTRTTPKGKVKLYTYAQWTEVLSEAVGNGVPVYMAKAFGSAVNEVSTIPAELKGLPMFELMAA